ncbi:SMP-30/gluconolactonase/LRE family protein [Phytoactinopolyspora alkaliphila]|uniref:SMP-30/gluconolactonase/LRE family protein n=1 Tax=Phytoactinopolyspora alkaliphila TaxID=1783498 RepID=A0A6N9YJ54_9ACTN|nr:SMP-30/gluconolactonase/LRE family protein [Phytoactinopolyspora alkaliphila]NED94994.1 SMP-30/gluconolactonase/LRE family protein [Phytoactinopolyspora alkaliphila]
MDAEPVAEADGPRTTLGESPRWDGAAWWWVDAAAGVVWRRRPDEHATVAWRTGVRTSLVQPASSGGVVVARGEAVDVLSVGQGSWEPLGRWADLRLGAGWLVNDGVADQHGRLWIGTIAPGRARHGGSLLRVERDGTVAEAARGFTLTNGMVWDAGGSKLYHVDTFERRVWVHQVDLDSGKVTGSQPFVDFESGDALPDGLAVDVEGGVWVAMYDGGQVRRFDASGRADVVVHVPPRQCTSVALGGTDGRDLLITTAREGYGDAASAREPLAGRLFRARSEYAGVPTSLVVTERADLIERT